MMPLFIGLVAFFIYFLQAFIYRKYWNRKLDVRFSFSKDSIYQGETCRLLEIIKNDKYLPLPMLQIKFQTDRNLKFADMKNSAVTDLYYRNDFFVLMPRQKVTRSLDFVGKKRGYYRIHGIDLISSDLFFTRESAQIPGNTWLYVYPRPYYSQEFLALLKQLSGEIITKRHLLEDPFEYKGIREYQPYDDMKSINWKATARVGELMVNEKNYTALKEVRVMINFEVTATSRREELLEGMIGIAAALADNFLSLGIGVSVYANAVDLLDSQILKMDAGAGNGSMEYVNRGLARLNVDGGVIPFGEELEEILHQTPKDSMTILVAASLSQYFQNSLTEYQRKGNELIWIFPRIGGGQPDINAALAKHMVGIDISKGAG